MSSVQIAPSAKPVFSDDGAVVMEIRSGLMYVSDPVGGKMLELISQGLSDDEIVATICSLCIDKPQPERVRGDLERFVVKLRSYGIVDSAVA